MSQIDSTHLREILNYFPETGIFTWKTDFLRKKLKGKIAGYTCKGYIVIGILGKKYPAHRLALIYTYGHCDSKDVDHINNIKTDNRIANLRFATRSENKQNLIKAKSDNISGYLGVSKNGNGWSAKLHLSGKITRLGTYKTPQEAHTAYVKAKRELHPFSTL